MGYERLTAQDATFLHIESSSQPQHVGSMALFEAGPLLHPSGRLRLHDARAVIDSRLHLVPRFRKRIMHVPFEQGRPVWVDDENFDLTYHVRLTALPRPGTADQLKALMGRLQSQLLDRSRPLWELWFVEGVIGDRIGLIQKTHHCLVDGISGVDVATVLLDLEPDPPPIEPEPWTPEPPPPPAELMIESIVERLVEPAELARSLRAAVRQARIVVDRLAGMGRTLSSATQSAPPTPWNVPVSAHRRFEETLVPLDRVKAVKDAARAAGIAPNCSLNDVVLAVCASSLRAFLESRGEPAVEGLVLKAMVPVSTRSDDERGALGNRVSMMSADLPVGEADPLERLRIIHVHMQEMKESGMAVSAAALIDMTNYLPPTMLGVASRLISRSRAVNLGITNVPGPQFPLYCMGSRMLEAYPYVGLVDGMALMIAVLSYDGSLAFGITGDRDALPDLRMVATGIEDGLAELERALAPKPAKRAAKATKATRATKAKTTKKARG